MKRGGANPKEAARWLKQAELDLQAARDSAAAGHHEWACFQAQQSGEKSLKAVLHFLGYRTESSHWLLDLLGKAAQHHPELAALEPAAKALDEKYIPTRYPNGLPSTSVPGTFYTSADSARCMSLAESIWNACKSILGGSGHARKR